MKKFKKIETCIRFLAVSALMTTTLAVAGNGTAHAALSADSFACEANQVYISIGDSGATTMRLDSVNPTDVVPAFANVIPTGIIPYRTNAIAYSNQDGYIYGLEFTNTSNDPLAIRNLVQIKDDGNPGTTVLDVNAALTAFGYPQLDATNPASSAYNLLRSPAGATYNNDYYAIIDSRQDNTPGAGDYTVESYIVRINLDTNAIVSVVQASFANHTVPPAGNEVRIHGDPYFGDFDIDPNTGIGYFFERNSQHMASMDLTTGAVTIMPTDYTSTTNRITGGSAAFSLDGTFYIYGKNDATVSTGQDTLYSADLTTGVLTAISSPGDASISDGTACSLDTSGEITLQKTVSMKLRQEKLLNTHTR